MTVRLKILEVSSGNISELTSNTYPNSPFSVQIELTAGNEYQTAMAIQAPNGQISAWSEFVPITDYINSINNSSLESQGDDLWIKFYLEQPDDNLTVEIETKIDNSDWKSTASSQTNTYYCMLRQGSAKLLDAAHDYYYSDNALHQIAARVRIVGQSNWIESSIEMSLFSPSQPHITEWLPGEINGQAVPMVHIEGEIPEGYLYRLFTNADNSGLISFISKTDTAYIYGHQYLSAVPQAFFDGQPHNLKLYATVYKQEKTLREIRTVFLGENNFALPLLSAITPNLVNNGCFAEQQANEWLIHIDVTGAPNAAAWGALVEGSSSGYSYGLNSPTELLIRGITLPIDGRAHRITFSYWYEIFGQRSNTIKQSVEVISMAANAPSNILVTYKKVKDPITNLQTSYEFTARLTFEQAKLRIQAQVDGGTFTDCAFDVLSNFPPMIRITGVQIPRDAYTHPVVFKMWHVDAVAGDSPAVLSDPVVAVFDIAPPPAPVNVSATVLRNRAGAVPDHVRVSWESDYDVDIVVLDDTGKRRTVGNGAEANADLIIENSSRFGTQDGTARQFRFGVLSKNRSAASAIVYAPPVSLMTTNAAVATQTPDDIAGIAQYMTHSQFLEWLKSEHATTDPAIITSVFTSALTKIKDVIAKGGSVTLSDVGIFRALWTDEKTVFRNGQYVSIPPVRNADFSLSVGFQKGTKLGQVMTDTEAALF